MSQDQVSAKLRRQINFANYPLNMPLWIEKVSTDTNVVLPPQLVMMDISKNKLSGEYKEANYQFKFSGAVSERGWVAGKKYVIVPKLAESDLEFEGGFEGHGLIKGVWRGSEMKEYNQNVKGMDSFGFFELQLPSLLVYNVLRVVNAVNVAEQISFVVAPNGKDIFGCGVNHIGFYQVDGTVDQQGKVSLSVTHPKDSIKYDVDAVMHKMAPNFDGTIHGQFKGKEGKGVITLTLANPQNLRCLMGQNILELSNQNPGVAMPNMPPQQFNGQPGFNQPNTQQPYPGQQYPNQPRNPNFPF